MARMLPYIVSRGYSNGRFGNSIQHLNILLLSSLLLLGGSRCILNLSSSCESTFPLVHQLTSTSAMIHLGCTWTDSGTLIQLPAGTATLADGKLAEEPCSTPACLRFLE
eukprot:2933510-Amphidinium_carterae.1